MSAKLKLVTILCGLLYDSIWRTAGEVLEMDAQFAEKLAKKSTPMVAFGEHTITIDDTGNPSSLSEPSFSPPDFPGAEYLLTVGITNLDQLGEVMTTRGDNWFKGITGLGKKTAALIADRYAELVPAGTTKPAAAAKPAATTKPAADTKLAAEEKPAADAKPTAAATTAPTT